MRAQSDQGSWSSEREYQREETAHRESQRSADGSTKLFNTDWCVHVRKTTQS